MWPRCGAQGGTAFVDRAATGPGVGGSVLLDAGTELDIVAVGGAGMFSPIGINAGGGGGSFVWDPTAIPAQPVPETSTWAMMPSSASLGLGFAGYSTAYGFSARAGWRLILPSSLLRL